ncbi:acyl-CoA dehydrogenase family protein [Planctomonas sp. JC2975]|uniref:acyl-CoA dehydrogenase family protein n=1 Tax=Planctomonas sp. JC2975 TaxID=2729626 RepID=UPI00197B52AE|nr:acyl-CoA dehydrogenase family protein [Planctomonas sp. JC2975]
MAKPAPHLTHDVANQAPDRVGLNEFTTNAPLVEGVARFDAAWAFDELTTIGDHVGSAAFQRDAVLANVHEPVLHAFDRHGVRIDEVEYDDSYHRIIGAAVASGAHTSAWADPRPGANVARAAAFMLFAQIEPGHACPISMTHAAVPALRQQPDIAVSWMPRLLSRDYDGRLVPGKRGALFGMAMTEKQGGSDVRANTTRAVPAGDAWLITGHKWFCSAPMSDAFLVLARIDDGRSDAGIGCFLVPRVLDDGSRNVFRIQRLKDKLGNRSNASSEVDFDGTLGYAVGEPGRGIRTIIEMVARTRLDCVLGTAAGMRQSVAEAAWHVRHRAAFGRTLIDQPLMRNVVADLALESEAATALAMRLARAHDDDASDAEIAYRRLATAVAKYWICKRGPGHAYEALECLGGNGYTEDYPLARRYREQPVMAVWEGSGNVIALDILRVLAREPDAVASVRDELASAASADRRLAESLRSIDARLASAAGRDPDDVAFDARRLAEDLAVALQAAVLVTGAPDAVSDAFCASRLGQDRAALYGTLPGGIDVGSILSRA